ncbi:hypothetical protein [Candidatus Laterigemmans baculatus]|uniref:hypothetical protein n=1 Tax=Candidatus Laterigemmans baculatus TaxID=2770505 RepID=UPI0013DA3286|nr:hypothetical protein [Candidatus Laterigemmans baculatus]
MAVASIVSIIGFSAIYVVRLHLAAATHHSDRYNARLLAMSAIEHALTEFNKNPNWKTDYVAGSDYPVTPPVISGGTFSWRLSDIQGGGRQLVGVGRRGESQAAFQVTLGPDQTWLGCGFLSRGNLMIGDGSDYAEMTVRGAPLCTNAALTIYNGSVYADVEAQTINGTVSGSATAPAAIRAIPDPNEVFSFYLANGTPLGDTKIAKQLISPTSNPNGATNPHGIYIIDARGGSVEIKESRIVGTIVVLNASRVELKDQLHWEPARPHFPALLVQGDIRCQMIQGNLSESAENVNFNPSGTPFRAATDAVRDDSYPPILAGIIYCTGNLIFDKDAKYTNTGDDDDENYSGVAYSAKFDGMVIVNGYCALTKKAKVTINYNAVHSEDPPPGFRPTLPHQIQRRSWQQVPVD